MRQSSSPRLRVDLVGNKEVLALRDCAEESKEGWVSVLEDLRARGATHMDLIVTDGHEGRLSALQALFPVTPRKPCLLSDWLTSFISIGEE